MYRKYKTAFVEVGYGTQYSAAYLRVQHRTSYGLQLE